MTVQHEPERAVGAHVVGLGHVGLHVTDLAAAVRFWTEVFDFQVTDGSVEQGMVFLSADPAVEHHMLLLRGGRTVPRGELLVQQISWRADSLEAVLEARRRLHARGVATMDVSHGNAVGVYFDDLDGNRCEIYWQTGWEARQVFKQGLDLDAEPDAVVDRVRAGVEAHAATGVREDVPFRLGPDGPPEAP